jgi:HSP20 family protein
MKNMLQRTKRPLGMLRLLDRIGKEEDLFSTITDDLFHFHGFSPLSGVQNPNFSPALDFVDTEERYAVKIEVPGIDKDSIDIEIDDDTLVIKGEKKNEYEETKDDVYVSERSYGAFRREIRLPQDCDLENIEATHKNGILCLDLPKVKTKEKEKKKITIGS